MTIALKSLDVSLVDGENNPVTLSVAYTLRGRDILDGALQAILDRHGENTLLLPLSARSGGGGIFQVDVPQGCTVAGISLEPANTPSIRSAENADVTTLGLHDIVICAERGEILVGAAITLDQVNRALAETLNPSFKVLGADLTSYTYAQAGATFMTGGMGPQRRYFSDSVTEVALCDGTGIRSISGESLAGYAGTYGWTGLVSALRCRYVRVPAGEIAFSLPVDSAPAALGALLSHLAPWCFLDETDGMLVNRTGGEDIVLGIEHVTLDAMGPMLAKGVDNAVNRRAIVLAEKCRAAGCDGLVFINAHSQQPADEFLLSLVDDPDGDSLTIAGIDLEHSEVFNDPEEMRAVREGIPYAARNQAPRGRFGFKGHTDATIRLDPDHAGDNMEALWRINREYVSALAKFFDANDAVDGQILVYGHMNPWGVDPHNRLTLACDDRADFERAVAFTHDRTNHFYRELDRLCREQGIRFVGGEKGAGSEREMFAAFPDPADAPAGLVIKYERQQREILAAPRCFNWRALPPYGANP